jgi:hypothetical protein
VKITTIIRIRRARKIDILSMSIAGLGTPMSYEGHDPEMPTKERRRKKSSEYKRKEGAGRGASLCMVLYL